MDGPFRKTAKGVQAIASRSRELPTRLRPLLILIDGQRRLADLQAMAGQFGDVPQMLAQLVQEGYAEPLGPPAAAAPGAPPAGTAASRPPQNLSGDWFSAALNKKR